MLYIGSWVSVPLFAMSRTTSNSFLLVTQSTLETSTTKKKRKDLPWSGRALSTLLQAGMRNPLHRFLEHPMRRKTKQQKNTIATTLIWFPGAAIFFQLISPHLWSKSWQLCTPCFHSRLVRTQFQRWNAATCVDCFAGTQLAESWKYYWRSGLRRRSLLSKTRCFDTKASKKSSHCYCMSHAAFALLNLNLSHA